MKIFDGKRFLVYGAGVSGRAAAKAIKHRGGKVDLIADKNGAFVAPPKKCYDAAVISPGVKPSHPVYEFCKSHGIAVTSELALGFSVYDGKAIAVTGTNGKTTVVRLISAMTECPACGNIGYPFVAAADSEKKRAEKAAKAAKKSKTAKTEAVRTNGAPSRLIVEVSSFQLHNGSITPDIAVITNIDIDHIDWHGSAEAYYACKCRIAESDKCEYLVLGEDVPVRALATLSTHAKIVYTSTSRVVDGAYISDGYFMFCGEKICAVDYYKLRGKHNLKNALCAIAAAKCAGTDNRKILSALATVEPEPHRLTDVGVYAGKRWIDDSKGTNVGACLAAVEATAGRLCLIVGGRDKALDFDALFEALDARVTDVVAMGESAQSLRDAAAKYGRRVRVVSSLSDAVDAAALSEAEIVLLSPACASFDEFENYGARGTAFALKVKSLKV